jgi:hypothetical protein
MKYNRPSDMTIGIRRILFPQNGRGKRWKLCAYCGTAQMVGPRRLDCPQCSLPNALMNLDAPPKTEHLP